MRVLPFRRKAVFLVLAGILLFPGKGEPWGAIQGVAETHQYILSEAMKLAASDPAFVQKFPSAEELVNHDYVLVTALGKSGPGPDVDGPHLIRGIITTRGQRKALPRRKWRIFSAS